MVLADAGQRDYGMPERSAGQRCRHQEAKTPPCSGHASRRRTGTDPAPLSLRAIRDPAFPGQFARILAAKAFHFVEIVST